jgi:hypothetical protein
VLNNKQLPQRKPSKTIFIGIHLAENAKVGVTSNIRKIRACGVHAWIDAKICEVTLSIIDIFDSVLHYRFIAIKRL